MLGVDQKKNFLGYGSCDLHSLDQQSSMRIVRPLSPYRSLRRLRSVPHAKTRHRSYRPLVVCFVRRLPNRSLTRRILVRGSTLLRRQR